MSLEKKERAISGAQLVMLLLVSRMFTLFTFAPKSGAVAGSTVLLAVPLAMLVTLALLLPFWWLRRRGGGDLLTAAFAVNRVYGVLASVCFGVFCLFMAGYTVSHFEFFMTSTVYQHASPWLFILGLMAVAAYGARLGLEAFSRLGTFVFVLLLAVIALICVSLIPEINPAYVVSPLLEGGEMLAKSVAQTVFGNAEVVVFLLLLPRTKNGGAKTFAWYAALGAALYEVLTLTVLTGLGDYVGTRLFPLYTAATAAQVSIFGRLDIVHIALWVFMAFLRATLYLYCASVCLRRICPRLSYPWGAAICATAAGGLALVASMDTHYLALADRLLYTGVPCAVLVLVFPLLTALLIPKKKGAPV